MERQTQAAAQEVAQSPSRRQPRRRRPRPLSIPRFRWVFQLFFLLVFLGLLTFTFWPVFSGLVSGFLLADPLIAASSAAHGFFRWEMLLAIPVILSPLFIGRAFCGYACPMGFLIELTGPKHERAPGSRARRGLRRVPLFGLVLVAIFIFLGSAWFLVADPISLLTRTTTTLLYPALGRLVFHNGLQYALQLLIMVMFLAVLVFSWIERRLWCRHLCPLGALLGLVGRFALFGRIVDESKCTSCKSCVNVCPMDAIRDNGRSTDMSRCEAGLECRDICRQGAVRWGRKPQKQHKFDPSRRALLAGGVAMFAGSFGLFKLVRPSRAFTPASGVTTSNASLSPTALLIRPPGAVTEDDFLATCARCDKCLKVCPTNVLQPAALEAGWEGVFTPRLDYARGYCEFTCAECGKVCPTRSIAPLDLTVKQRRVIGLARIDRTLCLPWAKGEECLVCEELCPVPRKAITFGAEGGGGGGRGRGRETTARTESAETVQTAGGPKLPRVNTRHCIGCGICQFNCPVQDPAPAIIVTRLPETTTLS